MTREETLKALEIHRTSTQNYINSILDDTISEKDFVNDFCNLPGSKRSPCKGKQMYKFLLKVQLIKPTN